MHFSSDIILFTAAFYYSAFLLPLSAGLIGRKREKSSKVYDAIMFIIVISPMTVAIGITYSGYLNFAVFLYLCAIYGYGIYVWRAKFNAISAKILLIISSSTPHGNNYVFTYIFVWEFETCNDDYNCPNGLDSRCC